MKRVTLAAVAALAQDGPFITEQVAQVDSKDMSFAVWAQLAMRVNYFLTRSDVRGIVITHGTDTLEETAAAMTAATPPKSIKYKKEGKYYDVKSRTW